jgi:hypothetical protein
MSANEKAAGSTLTREIILRGLQALSEALGKQGITGEVCLFGGTVMVLTFTARLTTKDVDALFKPTQTIRELARHIAHEQHLPADWLNDGVKGFVSARHETTPGNLPQFPHLRLTMPVPEYLLAMKCMAVRIGGTNNEPSDVTDMIFLIRHLKLKSANEVLDPARAGCPAVAADSARQREGVTNYSWQCAKKCLPSIGTGVPLGEDLKPFEQAGLKAGEIFTPLFTRPVQPNHVAGAKVLCHSFLTISSNAPEALAIIRFILTFSCRIWTEPLCWVTFS